MLGPNARFIRLRLGILESDIIDGQISVSWITGEPGGRTSLPVTFPCYTAFKNEGWGIECGFGQGMIGIFGFTSDNQALLLGTVIPETVDRSNYAFKNPISSGEFRISSKAGSSIFLDSGGNISVSSPGSATVVTIAVDGSMSINSNKKLDINVNGNVSINSNAYMDLSAKAIMLGGSDGVVTAPGLPAGMPITDLSQLQVSRTVTAK